MNLFYITGYISDLRTYCKFLSLIYIMCQCNTKEDLISNPSTASLKTVMNCVIKWCQCFTSFNYLHFRACKHD